MVVVVLGDGDTKCLIIFSSTFSLCEYKSNEANDGIEGGSEKEEKRERKNAGAP